MPPQQCPSCGRFLKAALVASLARTAADCPGCGTALSVSDFAPSGQDPSPRQETDVSPDDAGRAVSNGSATTGVVDDVGAPTDVLEGWDPEGPPSRWLDDQPPFPEDAAIVAGATLVGAIVGAICSRHAVRGAIAGAALGALGAGVARRIWELED